MAIAAAAVTAAVAAASTTFSIAIALTHYVANTAAIPFTITAAGSRQPTRAASASTAAALTYTSRTIATTIADVEADAIARLTIPTRQD